MAIWFRQRGANPVAQSWGMDKIRGPGQAALMSISPSPHVPAPIPAWLPRLLGFFIAIGPAATDIYLPAFPAVEATFGTASGTAQLTLAAWFAGGSDCGPVPAPAIIRVIIRGIIPVTKREA